MNSRDYYLGWAREMLRLAREAQSDTLHKGWLKAAAYEALAEKAEAREPDNNKRD